MHQLELSASELVYILLREAYIANTINDTSGTSGDSDKCKCFKFTYKATGDVEDPPHTRVLTHTCTYTYRYTTLPKIQGGIIKRTIATSHKLRILILNCQTY